MREAAAHRRRFSPSRGYALIAVTVFILVVSLLGALFLKRTELQNLFTGFATKMAARRLDAQGALDLALKEIQRRFELPLVTSSAGQDSTNVNYHTALPRMDENRGQIETLQFYVHEIVGLFAPGGPLRRVGDNTLTVENAADLGGRECSAPDNHAVADWTRFIEGGVLTTATTLPPGQPIGGGCRARLINMNFKNDDENDLGVEIRLRVASVDRGGRAALLRTNVLLVFPQPTFTREVPLAAAVVSKNNFLGGYTRGSILAFLDLTRVPLYFDTRNPPGAWTLWPQAFNFGVKGEIWIPDPISAVGKTDTGLYMPQYGDDEGGPRIRGRVETVVTNTEVAPELTAGTNLTYDPDRFFERVTDPAQIPLALPPVLGRLNHATGEPMAFADILARLPSVGRIESNGGDLFVHPGGNPQDDFNNVPAFTPAAADAGASVIIDGNWRIEGIVPIDGDVIIRGPYEGTGTILASGNIYIVGDIEGAQLNSVSLQDLGERELPSGAGRFSIDDACGPTSGLICAQLSLVTNQNVLIGNVANAHVASFLLTDANKEANYFGIPVAPAQGNRAGEAPVDPASVQVGVYRCGDALFNTPGPPNGFPSPCLETSAGGILPWGSRQVTSRYSFSYLKDVARLEQQTVDGWGFVRNGAAFPDGIGRADPGGLLGGKVYSEPEANGLTFGGGWISSAVFWRLATDPASVQNPYCIPVGALCQLNANGLPVARPCDLDNDGNCDAPATSPDGTVWFDSGTDGQPPPLDRQVVSQVSRIDATIYAMGYVAGIGGDLPLRAKAGFPPNATPPADPPCMIPGDPAYQQCFDQERWDGEGPIPPGRDGLTIVGGVFANYVNLLSGGGVFIYHDDRENLLPVDSDRYVRTSSYREGGDLATGP